MTPQNRFAISYRRKTKSLVVGMSVLPARPKGPHLNAMRAFEAAARHVSFVAAAEELSVTPAAISQHVKTLEAWAGVALFRRHAQGVALTEAGHALVGDFVLAFDAVATAMHRLRNLHPNAEIHIAALPSIAQLWLPKRLARIREAWPHLSFSVTAMETPPRLSRELYDMSIFFTEPKGEPDQIVLARDQIVPVCAPSFAHRIQTAADLDAVALLHDQTWKEDWATWATLSKNRLSDATKGPKYSLYSLAVEEAKAGAGVLMGHVCLLEEPLATGRLVSVLGEAKPTGKALVLSLPTKKRRHPESQAIAEGLLGSAVERG